MANAPVILITGASSGIGAATARTFAKEGYHLVLAARRIERLTSLAVEIQSQGGRALPLRMDVTRHEDIYKVVDTSLERFGQIDILFNNAAFGRLDWLENLDAQDDIQAQIDTNLSGLIRLTRAVLPHMMACRSGHIINMASMASYVATPTYTVYAASKFGVRGFTDALRREAGGSGIRVSGIYPGAVATEFVEVAGIKRTTQITTPEFLLLSVEDVARAVLRLARRPRRTLVIPRLLHLAIWFDTLAPGLVDWLIERIFVLPERKG